MSYDIDIGDQDFNMTYNVGCMWYDCYKEKGIREIYGMTGVESIPVLIILSDHMEDNESKLRGMEPLNGWGSYDGALNFVKRLLKAARENKDEVWSGD